VEFVMNAVPFCRSPVLHLSRGSTGSVHSCGQNSPAVPLPRPSCGATTSTPFWYSWVTAAVTSAGVVTCGFGAVLGGASYRRDDQ
jgi:hypothetical protein